MTRTWQVAAVLVALAARMLAVPGVHAQATVETGGATAGAANNVTTLAPDFTGMSSTISSTASAAPTPSAAAGVSSADQSNASEASVQGEHPGQSESDDDSSPAS